MTRGVGGVYWFDQRRGFHQRVLNTFTMKIPGFITLFILAVSSSVWAVEIGHTYDQVIAEKGNPATRLEMGETLVLNYPDQRIKLNAKRVVEVKATVAEPAPAAPATPRIAPGTWTTNYQAALAQARQQDARVFLFFTGSDWCGWCKRLEAEVLSTPRFKAYAAKNLILVKLDFPRGVPQTDVVKAQNEALAEKFQVRGFPTVVVLNSKGDPVGRLGYQPGGPAPFVEALGGL
jgi:protein disulfide-isomerase